jgi:ribose transport system ATP-binding protein
VSGPVPAVQVTNVTKSFGDTHALKGVDFEVAPGEVHALLGENGAGKSTLLKIIQGVYRPDGGEVRIFGEQVKSFTPDEMFRLGVSMIFQEFSLIPTLSVADNIFLGRETKGRFGLSDRAAMRKRTRELFDEIGIKVNPRATAESLSTGYKQLVEVAKAVARDARVLIMDEPTASLAEREVDLLFGLMETLKQRGVAVIYVSHRMEEIFQVSDRITVLRDGRRMTTTPASDITGPELVRHIVGREVAAFTWVPRTVDRTGSPRLEVQGLSAANGPFDVDLTVHPGEIVGVAGLMGSGRSRLARALAGLADGVTGEIRLDGESVKVGNPIAAIDSGIALVPEDRRTQGLIGIHSIRANASLPVVERFSHRWFIRDRDLTRSVQDVVERLDLRPPKIWRPVGNLSGGNQQKIVISKWLLRDSKVLILDEVTAGIDIGTKTEIVRLMRELADAGMSIVVVSSEAGELLAMADRIVIMNRGRVASTMSREELQEAVDPGASDAEQQTQMQHALEARVQGLSTVRAGG